MKVHAINYELSHPPDGAFLQGTSGVWRLWDDSRVEVSDLAGAYISTSGNIIEVVWLDVRQEMHIFRALEPFGLVCDRFYLTCYSQV